jgi:hypothetical protein
MSDITSLHDFKSTHSEPILFLPEDSACFLKEQALVTVGVNLTLVKA